jgi:prepilin-type N-terminal cleavage/methylation domain-containing protein
VRAGFTLVEVLIVLAILGLSAGLALPPLLDWAPDSRQTGAVGEVLRIVHSARTTALLEGRAMELTIDPTTGKYWIAPADSDRPLGAPHQLSLGDAELAATAPRLTLRWDARGRMNGDSILVHTERGVRVIGADRWTGVPYARAR